jgi:hypothetical protein
MEKIKFIIFLRLKEWKDSFLFLVVSNCSGTPSLAQGDGHGQYLTITHICNTRGTTLTMQWNNNTWGEW